MRISLRIQFQMFHLDLFEELFLVYQIMKPQISQDDLLGRLLAAIGTQTSYDEQIAKRWLKLLQKSTSPPSPFSLECHLNIDFWVELVFCLASPNSKHHLMYVYIYNSYIHINTRRFWMLCNKSCTQRKQYLFYLV